MSVNRERRMAGRRRAQTGLYVISVFIIVLLTLSMWDAVLGLVQVIALVSCIALLYLLGMMQGMLAALGMEDDRGKG